MSHTAQPFFAKLKVLEQKPNIPTPFICDQKYNAGHKNHYDQHLESWWCNSFCQVHASSIRNGSHHQGLCFLFSKSWPWTFSPFWLQSISLFGSLRRHLSVTLFLSCLKTTENRGYLIFRALSDVHLNLPDGMSSLPLLAFLSTRRGGQKETRWSKGLWWVLQTRLVWSSSSLEGGAEQGLGGSKRFVFDHWERNWA